MIFKRILFVSIFFACAHSQAQVVIKDWDNQLDDVEFRKMCFSAKEIINSKNTDFRQIARADIFPMEDSWYLTMEGMFDVYQWKQQEWVNLYKAEYWGYNFASLKFLNGGNLYSYGGHGFWKVHGQIIKFYGQVNEWDIIPSSTQLPYGLGLPGNKELYILSKDSVTIFDFKNEKSSSVFIPGYNDSIPYFANKKVIESRNYTLAVNFNQILLDKRKRSIHYLARGAFIFFHGPHDGYYHIIGDTVIVYSNQLEFEMSEIINADLNRYQQIYPANITALSESTLLRDYSPIAVVMILLMTGLIIFIYKKKRQPIPSEDINQLVEQLNQYAGMTLDSEALDKALNIPDYLSPENARYKRSKLVNEINEYGRIKHAIELITRIKDPDDKRKFLYSINTIRKS